MRYRIQIPSPWQDEDRQARHTEKHYGPAHPAPRILGVEQDENGGCITSSGYVDSDLEERNKKKAKGLTGLLP